MTVVGETRNRTARLAIPLAWAKPLASKRQSDRWDTFTDSTTRFRLESGTYTRTVVIDP